MRVGVVRETFPGERRVALVPGVLASLKKAGLEVLIESQAGAAAGFTDAEYQEKGATVVADRAEVLRQADVLLQVRTLGANPEAGPSDLEHLRSGQTLIGLADPLIEAAAAGELARRGVNLFAMELIPRITRAQSMDVLSSMASIAGYKAVLLAAAELPKLFPMMMTAAGTITPAKVFVIGAGVAGLQAIATAQRLGAIVHGYDLRPAVKEQVQSLGAKFVELDVAAADAEAMGGYAKAMDEDFYRRQREAMARVVADMDVVITTAAVPGQKAPVLITREMLTGMRPGSVVLDLAAERGGNCEATVPGETVQVGGVSVLGPVNLPATVPFHASQMYAKNITTFLLHVVKNGELQLTADDEITRETLVVRDGQVVHPRVKERLEA
ncbi:MAG TPA: Re/Si-specific NAD(P)(+) transhydrogenase subunit alpha [Phycisphaerae bacterium]|mgnify:CR=1 FL=1|nr:Re/Si-specific NAD(P)(+) transhydrogenase subunit alpha [Phycisphaerae bacterium]HOM52249.1 Re/Si-specific NAD(P)(+) transhydrogenase subunit alpha [Phycisphaerae bacterium]HOQ84143.1 Re/Si-specific NAD(P)(+) transhydrogenase subunit alpha [Phycisphaerae bacterium]HPZ99312.1 Re/Si-specific NAD(P)(+) transhydrogenase subunit alpha [Phycisphaerae bacterium]HQE26895.1 Re/Si-specific NAD(P)(+) transhydrogenase subunit alpha [Phycisphaerae bacterium]